MSDTPRTNKKSFLTHDSQYQVCDADFARILERELNAANLEIEEKRKDIVWLATEKAKLENYVKRLEEAGDVLFENSYPSMWDLPAAAALKLSDQNAWRKAKEANL